MEILCKSHDGQYFNDSLLQLIEEGNNEEVYWRPILKNENLSHLTDSSGATLLHVTAKYGNVWFARRLIELGANVDAQNYVKTTPLMIAVNNQKIDIVKVLLEANADIFIPDQFGHCALGQAFFSDQYEELLTAFEYRVTSESLKTSIHTKNEIFHRNSPLYYFNQFENAEVTRVLLENGSPVDAKEPSTGETSLHMAVRNLDLDNVRVLIEYGANVNAETDDGEKPLECLDVFEDENKVLAILDTLMTAGATLHDSNENLYAKSLLQFGTKKIVRRVLRNWIDLEVQDNKEYTALHYLSFNTNADVLAELCDYSFDTNTQSSTSKLALLHCAAISGNSSTVKYLLGNGANVNVECVTGCTALNFIICSDLDVLHERLDEFVKCIEILLIYGAIPEVITEHYEDVIMFYAFKPPISNTCMALMRPILAHLSSATVSKKFAEQYILPNSQYRHFFELKQVELEKMKRIQLGTTVTLFEFLIASNENISQYARHHRIIPSFFSELKKYNLDSYYQLKIHCKYLTFIKLAESREKFANTIDIFFALSFNFSVPNVAEKIVSYLDDCCVLHFANSSFAHVSCSCCKS